MVTLKPNLQQCSSCWHCHVLLAYSQILPALSSTSSPTMSNHICKPKCQHQQLPPPLTPVPSVSNFPPAAVVVYGNPRKRNAAIWGKRSERGEQKKKKIECSAVHSIDLAACVCVCGRERESGREREEYVCVRVCLPSTCQKKLFTLFKFRNKGNSKSNKCSLAFSSRKRKNGRFPRRERKKEGKGEEIWKMDSISMCIWPMGKLV